MLQIALSLPERIQNYIQTTPPELIGAHALFAVGWVPIAGVIVWGLLQLWLDAKQGEYAGKLKWVLLRVDIPQDAIQTPKGMENFFTILAGSKSTATWKEKWLLGKFQAWFSMEIVSMGGQISFYIRCVKKYRDMVEASLYAQYPEAQISEAEDYIDALPNDYPNDSWDIWGTELKLSKANHLPIRSWIDFEHQGEKDQRFKDPLLTLLEGMGKMAPGEMYWLQVLIMQPDEQDWRKAGEKEINKAYGIEEKKKKGMFEDTIGWIPQEIGRQIAGIEFGEGGDSRGDDFAAFKVTPAQRDLLDAVARKISKLGWYSKIRFVYGAKKELYRIGTIASMTKGIFHQYGHLGWNKFGIHGDSTPKDDYPWQEWQMEGKKRNLIQRYKSRSWAGGTPFILNCEELATLYHFPAADARTPVLTSLGARRSEAPVELAFAGDDVDVLPNLDRSALDFGSAMESRSVSSLKPRPIVTPTVTAPTRVQPSEPVVHQSVVRQDIQSPVVPVAPSLDDGFPQPGMPAPLPPGLDLSDEPIHATETPTNLPVE